MRLFRVTMLLLAGVLFLASQSRYAQADDFKIGIMQDRPGIAQQYAPMLAFFKAKNISVKLQGYRSYTDAAMKFDQGNVDAMVAGSGVAGSMIIKGVASPLVRPVSVDGTSTYWAVVLAPKGSAPFNGNPDYFKDKRIICSALASSGEFYARAMLGPKRELMEAASHGVAIKALASGQADVAIVKNRVWDAERGNYPTLDQVGNDTGENPNNTMIISNKTDKAVVERVKAALLGLEKDTSPEAMELKKSLKIKGYIPTTADDFSHTIPLLEKAGVTKDFQFQY